MQLIVDTAVIIALQLIVALSFCASLPGLLLIFRFTLVFAWESSEELAAIFGMTAFFISASTKLEVVGVNRFEPLAAGNVQFWNVTGAGVVFAPPRVATLCAGASLDSLQLFSGFRSP